MVLMNYSVILCSRQSKEYHLQQAEVENKFTDRRAALCILKNS